MPKSMGLKYELFSEPLRSIYKSFQARMVTGFSSKVLTMSFCKSQFPHKSINLLLTITD